MEDKILEIIRESLPEKEVGVVKKVFTERDTYKATAENLEKELEMEQKENKDLKEELAGLEGMDKANSKKEKKLNERDEDITKRETRLEITLAQNSKNILQTCFDTVMRVPTIRKNIQKTIPVPDNNGYIQQHQESSSEETTEE